MTADERLKALYQCMADKTHERCEEGCQAEPKWSCCSPEYCKEAIRYAKERWDLDLVETGHPTLPMLGPEGCIAPPHARPLCTVHICSRLVMTTDFYDECDVLREEINVAEYAAQDEREALEPEL